jgi:hypothetical protein
MSIRLKRAFLYTTLPGLIVLNWWIFRQVIELDYFRWYLDKGPIISLSMGFVALIWEELDTREGLLSANPVLYLATCFTLAGILSNSLGVHLEGSKYDRTKTGWCYTMGYVWDIVATVFLALIIIPLLLAWIIVVAPLNYVVTLVAGAPARQQLRGSLWRSVVREAGKSVVIDRELNLDRDLEERLRKVDPGSKDVSFARKPFAVTQALAALVLWLGGTVHVWLS